MPGESLRLNSGGGPQLGNAGGSVSTHSSVKEKTMDSNILTNPFQDKSLFRALLNISQCDYA